MDEVQARDKNLEIISVQMKHKTMYLFEITKGITQQRLQIRKMSPGAVQHLEVREMRKNKPGRLTKEPQRQESVGSGKLSEEKAPE